jgi:hypothetical protein
MGFLYVPMQIVRGRNVKDVIGMTHPCFRPISLMSSGQVLCATIVHKIISVSIKVLDDGAWQQLFQRNSSNLVLYRRICENLFENISNS